MGIIKKRAELIDCPGGCGLRLPDSDKLAQAEHMRAAHPEIILDRMRAAGLHAEADALEAIIARETPSRMWRKLVALRWDQKEGLEQLAAERENEPGNISAVIRDAVDEYVSRRQQQAGAVMGGR